MATKKVTNVTVNEVPEEVITTEEIVSEEPVVKEGKVKSFFKKFGKAVVYAAAGVTGIALYKAGKAEGRKEMRSAIETLSKDSDYVVTVETYTEEVESDE